MKGTTLLETIVVVAIVAILSMMGVNTINNFKKDAVLDNAANEFLSEVRSARSKSMSGELLTGEAESDFDPDNLPEYGINISGNSYYLIRKCIKADASDCSGEPAILSVYLGDNYEILPEGSFYFDRITGNTAEKTITITDKNGSNGKQISISNDILITTTKIR